MPWRETNDGDFSQRPDLLSYGMTPGEIATIEHVGYLRGQRLASVLVSPARYNALRRELDVTTDMELIVTVEDATGDEIKDVGPLQNVLKGTVLNADAWRSTTTGNAISGRGRRVISAAGQVCWCSGSNWQDAAASAISCGADYLIIVSDSLIASTMVDTLAIRRAEHNGFNVAIVQMSQIDAEPDTATTPTYIRALIDSVYSAQSAVHMGDGRLGFVLLLGDAYDPNRSVLIPSYYGYADSLVPKEDDLKRASDAYYSFLDDDPFVDRFPDVLVGRLPVDRDDANWEITNAIRKIASYEPLPNAAWADSILVISGNNPGGFTFGGENLLGFQGFFDSVLTRYTPAGRVTIQEHRLALGSPQDPVKHEAFGDKVAASMGRGKWLTAFFDHGHLFYWEGAFYPRSYEFVENVGKPSIVFSIGSHTTQFDLTADWAEEVMGSCSVGNGCTVQPPSSIQCESPGYATIDPCDVIAERLLVQEGGAVAVFGYSRSQLTTDAQADFANLFRSLSEQNPSTLGELLVGARMFRISNNITARNLMLLGDPALDIRTRAPAAADTIDVAVGIHDIRMTGEADGEMTNYVDANSTLELTATIRNPWKADAVDVEVEYWQGEPGGPGSAIIASDTIPTIPAYGSETVAFDVASPDGNIEIYVVVDPDDDIVERNEDNNVASRSFLGLPYENDYPIRLDMAPTRPIVAADITSDLGSEFLVGSSGEIRCYAQSDTTPQWAYLAAGQGELFLSAPIVGHVYKSSSIFAAVENKGPSGASQLRVLQGDTGSAAAHDLYQNTYFGSSAGLVKWVLADLGQDDESMELVTLAYRDGGPNDSLFVQAYTPAGALLAATLVHWVTGNVSDATMAIADLDANGTKEIVVLMSVAFSTSELKVYTYGSSGFSLLWEREVSVSTQHEPALVLLDVDGDGEVEILCSGTWPGHIVRLYDAAGTAVWGSDVSANARPKFAAGDIDGDGAAEVVIADTGRIRVISAATGQLLDSQATAGSAVSGPYLVDLDGDGQLDVVSLFETENIYFYPEQYDTRIYVLDENLDPLVPTMVFSPTSTNHAVVPPAIHDLDDDGRYEMVYVSTDQYLHVFELGTAAGDAAWPQRFANALNTGLNEQPILGDGYTHAVSLYQRTRMLGHVSLDSIAAPSLYVGHGTEVRVDTSTVDPYRLRAFGTVRMKGSATAPVVFRSEPPASGTATWGGLHVDNRFASDGDPDTLLGVEIADADTALSGRSPLFVKDAAIHTVFAHGVDVEGAGKVVLDNVSISGAFHGIDARDNTTVVLLNSTIEDCSQYGVVVSDDSRLDATSTTFAGNEFATVLSKETGSWVFAKIRDCTFTNNAEGVWVGDTGDSTVVVEDGTIEDCSGTGVYAQAARLVVDGTTIRGGEIGISATMQTELELSNATIEDASLFGVTVTDSWLDAAGTLFDANDIGLNLVTIPCVEPDPPCPYSWVKAVVRDCNFTDNGDGVWIENDSDSSVVVDDCVIDENTTNGVYIEGSGDVEITRNEITNNTIGVNSYGSSPSIRSRNVIRYNAGGIKCDDFSTAVVESCTVTNNTNAFAVLNDANPDLGHETGGSSMGYNIVRPNSGYYVVNLTSNTIKAEIDYWPTNPPTINCDPPTSKFYGPVDYEPDLQCDLPDLSLRYEEPLLSGEAAVPDVPKQFRLGQNYPNPFNPTTTIAYEVPEPGSRVEIVLFDVTGSRVAVLVEEHKAPGFYALSWDGQNRNGEPLASGVYFLRMRAGRFVETKKLLLLK